MAFERLEVQALDTTNLATISRNNPIENADRARTRRVDGIDSVNDLVFLDVKRSTLQKKASSDNKVRKTNRARKFERGIVQQRKRQGVTLSEPDLLV